MVTPESVPAGDTRFGDLLGQNGLAFGLVLGLNDLSGLVLVGGAKTGAFAGFGKRNKGHCCECYDELSENVFS